MWFGSPRGLGMVIANQQEDNDEGHKSWRRIKRMDKGQDV